ncbi:sigma-54-dependent Fis family transcriptional regulator [Aeribacillus composti]|uniref:Sigma-54-dependent Fis family transcriptional regulator n=2 Tax=Aeribacillus pallidus TaxID=33936 RepID=A0A161WAX2_9BACI|nr:MULTISPECIES: sigma-54-dependent Fis family transcriptional regulator [Aeribacillus]ASS90201.1 sigma-54-dependent Fis family transcriptional regulator [Aeribacillus pallidus]KZM57537.1 sigma-54-dependent Fis family transcriptional regulator [Aeribacillus pallidus]MED0650646.1 sigma-54-dependent Fis family transcriptional regulator [Aeribacillus composti]MED4486449.1 sigma-54-dependent Fis family transcriptional regulator [Aeribacillus pallidus]TVZ79900.1 transcriptional regulator of acetoin
MGNPYISIFSTHNLPDKKRDLETLWEMFVERSWEDKISGKIRKNVLDSWSRCQETGVDPMQLQTKAALTEYELNHLLKGSELYQIAKPIIDNLFYKLKGTRYLITLTDENGCIIYLKGEPYVLREAEKMNFTVGMDWSENAAGTNAIGTCIVTQNPIQIFSAEHFCQGCHPWTCSSAPIIHPFTKEVIGVIDFTGFWEDAQPHTLGLAVSTAQVIEKQLAYVYMKVNNYLIDYFFQCANKWKNDHILVLNHAFYVVKSSEKLMELFNLKHAGDLAVNPDFHPLINEMKRMSKFSAKNDISSDLMVRDFKVLAIEPIHFKGEVAGYMVVLKDNKKVFRTTARYILKDEPWNDIIGTSDALLTALNKCYKAAPSNVPILLLGESGTGKEKIAKSIHQSSQRRDKPFLAINCGAIPKELIGSELFGYESGTFTGGSKEGKKGKFEEANEGTLFLDEIGEMPLDLQVHLLRVLQEKEIMRLGSSQTIPINVRIIAATNKNLYALCKQGLFREDLFFRLNVVTVNIPPLRERREDIPLIADYFLKKFAKKYARESLSIAQETLNYFLEYSWPGNIREMQNVIEYAVIFSDSPVIRIEDLPAYFIENRMSLSINNQLKDLSLIEVEEQKVLVRLLEETGWNLSAVAKKMNIARSTLYRKLKKYQLKQT